MGYGACLRWRGRKQSDILDTTQCPRSSFCYLAIGQSCLNHHVMKQRFTRTGTLDLTNGVALDPIVKLISKTSFPRSTCAIRFSVYSCPGNVSRDAPRGTGEVHRSSSSNSCSCSCFQSLLIVFYSPSLVIVSGACRFDEDGMGGRERRSEMRKKGWNGWNGSRQLSYT